MSLPPSATPRSIANREEPSASTSNDIRFQHRPSIASKRSAVDMGPPSVLTPYHSSSVAPSTPFSVATPRTADTSRVQPSLQ